MCIDFIATVIHVRHNVTVNSYVFSVPPTVLRLRQCSYSYGILPKTYSIPDAPESNKIVSASHNSATTVSILLLDAVTKIFSIEFYPSVIVYDKKKISNFISARGEN